MARQMDDFDIVGMTRNMIGNIVATLPGIPRNIVGTIPIITATATVCAPASRKPAGRPCPITSSSSSSSSARSRAAT